MDMDMESRMECELMLGGIRNYGVGDVRATTSKIG